MIRDNENKDFFLKILVTDEVKYAFKYAFCQNINKVDMIKHMEVCGNKGRLRLSLLPEHSQ